jgi:hypothetical protein
MIENGQPRAMVVKTGGWGNLMDFEISQILQKNTQILGA